MSQYNCLFAMVLYLSKGHCFELDKIKFFLDSFMGFSFPGQMILASKYVIALFLHIFKFCNHLFIVQVHFHLGYCEHILSSLYLCPSLK